MEHFPAGLFCANRPSGAKPAGEALRRLLGGLGQGSLERWGRAGGGARPSAARHDAPATDCGPDCGWYAHTEECVLRGCRSASPTGRR